ncbi:Hypothetical phage protein [Lacticaseibacillus paracasei]|nr:Hypothetical phage protein [Lacticaseibacillus paracasei]
MTPLGSKVSLREILFTNNERKLKIMKLNPDCLRDVLLVVETNASTSQWVEAKTLLADPRMSSYSYDEIAYHVRQANWAGLLAEVKWFMGAGFLIKDLTPSGHQFLADIREDTNWNKVKSVLKKVGSFSISAITQAAAGVVQADIQKHLGL